MDLLLEAQLQCFKWLGNILPMGERARKQEKTRNLLSDIPTSANKVLFSMLKSWLVLKQSCKIALTPS